MFANILVIIIIVLTLGLAAWKLVRDRKKGSKCPGCSGCPIGNACKRPELIRKIYPDG